MSALGAYVRRQRVARGLDIEGAVDAIHRTQPRADMYWSRGRWERWLARVEAGGRDFDQRDVAMLARAYGLTPYQRRRLRELVQAAGAGPRKDGGT
jgi:hypothetical protein